MFGYTRTFHHATKKFAGLGTSLRASFATLSNDSSTSELASSVFYHHLRYLYPTLLQWLSDIIVKFSSDIVSLQNVAPMLFQIVVENWSLSYQLQLFMYTHVIVIKGMQSVCGALHNS